MGGGLLTWRLLASSALAGRLVSAPDGLGNGGGKPWKGPSPRFAALEPRVLFDAALAETVLAVGDGHEAAANSTHLDSSDTLIAALMHVPAAVEAVQAAAAAPVEIAFVDSHVEDPGQLIAALGSNVEVHILSADRDGVAQIAEILGDRQGVAALHIISHGSAGSLELGSSTLTAQSMQGAHADELAVIADALSGDADILVYGCDFASGDAGQYAVGVLAAATGADVAASDDATGAAELGGDWLLEKTTGSIDVATFADEAYQGLLAPFVVTPVNGVTVTAMTLAQQMLGSNVTVLSATLSGQNSQAGIFSSATGYTPAWIAFDSGVIFSSGDATGLTTVNDDDGVTTGPSGFTGTFAPFSAIGGNTSYNASYIDINFIPTTNRIAIQFVFGSDEYNEYVYGGVADAMGIWVNGTNIAVTPTGGEIGIDTINNAGTYTPYSGPASSAAPSLFVNNDLDDGGPSYQTQMDGFTRTLGATITVNPGVSNTIRLGVADIGDGLLDSWVLVKADSVQANLIANNDTVATTLNTPVTFDVLSNDIDFDGDTKSIVNVADQPITPGQTITLASGATVKLNADSTFTVTPATGSTLQELFTYTITDGNGNTATAYATVNIIAGSPPALDLDASGPGTDFTPPHYQIGGAAVSIADIDSSIIDDGNVTKATIGISNVFAGDTLTVGTLPVGVTVDPSSTATNIILVGNVAPSVMADAIEAIKYSNSLGAPNITDRLISVQTTDATGLVSNLATSTIKLNAPPVDGDEVVAVTEDVTLSVPAATGLLANNVDPTGGTASITGYTVATVAGTPVIGTPFSIPGKGDLTINANGSYTFVPAANYNGPVPLITYTVSDGQGAADTSTLSFSVSAVNDLPVIDLDGNNSSGAAGADFVATYIENGPGINIVDTADLSIFDADNAIVEIVVTLTDGQIGDTLNFPSTLPGGITAAVSPVATLTAPGTMTVTFTGAASNTLADWTSLLNSVTFLPSTNDVNNPNPADRHITVQTSDASSGMSNVATATIHVTPQNDAPTLDLDNDNSSGINAGNVLVPYTENDGATALHSIVLTSDLDNTTYQSAVITATNPQAGDQLYVNGVLVHGGDTGSVAGIPYAVTVNGSGQPVITFTGTATLANYTIALQSIAFNNTSENPSTVRRDITFQVNDGTDVSPLRHAYVNVTAVNDPPVGTAIANQGGQDSAAITPLDASTHFSDPDGPSLSYSFGPGAPSWLSINSTTGVITGTPPHNASTTTNGVTPGTWPVTVVASDGSLSASESFAFVITNPTPVAQDDQLNASEGGAVAGNVFSNNGSGADNDPDGDTFSVTQVGGVPGNVNNATAGSSGGLFTIGSTGTLSFSDNGDFNDLAVGQTRDTTITYQITDSDGGTATATVTVTVTGANDVPVLVTPFADPASVTDGNTGFTFATAASFNDPDTADVLTYALGSGAPAWLTINATTGVVSVVGAIPANASQGSNVVGGPLGAYDIQVIASDGNGGTVNDTFRLTVTNPPPVAVDDAGAAGEDSATVSGNVLTGPGNDHDTAPDSDPLTISEVNGSGALIDAAVTGSAGGSFTVSAAGVWTFNPGLDFQYLAVGQTATTSVSYTVSDGNGGTDTATLTMTVTGSNDGPVPVGTIATQSGTDGAAITPLSVLGNFQDPDTDDTLTFSVPSGLVPPGLVFNPVTATFSGTAAANASQGSTPGQPAGTYVVPVTVDDGHGGTLTQNVTFTFGNLAPAATNDTATISEDGASIGGNALLNDHDTAPDSDPLHVSAINGQPGLVGQPVAGSAGGTFTLDGNGQWTFTPGLDFQNLNAGDTRVTTLSYQVADGQGGMATATVSVTVTGSNDAPVPLGPIGPQSGVDGQAIAPIAAGASFDNPTALPLTFSATGLPPGLMIDPATGVITGTLQNDASVAGPYVINVTASAPGGVSATVPVVLNVSNPVPVAQDDGVATAANSPVSISPLANDADPDGDALTVSVATAPAYGTVVANPDGTFTYTPSSGYTGSDSFTYQVSDGQGGFDTATVTIAVGVPNPDGPTGTAMAPASGTDGSAITPIGTAASFSDPTGDPLSFSAAGLPPGLAIDPATGVITGTLPNDASLGGPYTVQVTATDPAGNQVTLPLVIVVVNPAPVAADDAVAVPLNDATTLNPLGNDSDPDGDALQVTYTSSPAHGTVVIHGDGTLTYTPDTGYTGPDSFTYTVSDGQGGTDTATVMLSVGAPLPGAPTAGPVPGQSGVDGAAVSIPVATLATVIDPDGDPLTYTAVGLPPGLSINPATGVITGTLPHDASQGGPYTVQVFASDPSGNSVGIPFLLSVTNPTPTAVNDVIETPEGAPVTIAVLANDADPDHDPLTVTSVTPPAHGSVVINADGSITYTPATGFSGSDTFSYTISDGNGGTSSATVSVDVGPVTTLAPPPAVAPVGVNDGETITPVSVLSGFGDPDNASGLVLSVDGAALPPGLSFNPTTGEFTGTLTLDASQGATPGEPTGTYIVPVTATDSHGATVTQLVTFVVGNIAPVVVADTGSIGEDAATVGGNALLNDHDTAPDADALHVSTVNGVPGNVGAAIAGSAGGTFTLAANGTWHFEPGLDFQNLNTGDTRQTSITYTVADGQGGTATATVTVTVSGSNDPPVALGPIPVQHGTDGAAITPIDAGGAFDNPAALPLTFSATGLPPGLSIDPSMGIIGGTLQNNASIAGPYIITVTATGPDGETASLPVQLEVANPPPVAQGDGAATAGDTPVIIAALANDSDPDGDVLLVSAVGTAGHGTVVINPKGTVTYTPDSGFTGTDSFTYTASDGQGGTSTATITVSVGAPSPTVPTGTPIPDAAGQDGSAITPIPVAGYFSDPNGDPLTFTATGLPPGLTINPVTGVITGTLPADASVGGPYTVMVTGTDPSGNQVTEPLVIAIANPAPVALDDAVLTPSDVPVTLNPLGNDSDPDGDPLQVSHVAQPAHGTVIINPDGSLTYTPDAGYVGPDSFTYTVSDGQGGTDIATVTLGVGVEDPNAPVADPVSPQSGTDGAPVSIDVADLSNAFDPDGGPLSYSATGLPPGLSINPTTGVISGTLPHDASAGGPYAVTVFATDPDGKQVAIPFTLAVANPPPVAAADTVETAPDTPVTIAVLANDHDPDHDPLTITSTTGPAHGTLSINPDGSITFNPTPGYVGPDSFTYTVSDGNGGQSTATVTIDVGPVDTLGPPQVVDPVNTTDGAVLPPLDVTGAFGDPDTVSGLTFSVDPSTLPPGITFNPATGTFSGTAANTASQGATPGEPAGTYIVPVTASDGAGGQTTVLVTFSFANLPPVASDDQSTSTEDAGQGGNVLTDPVTGDHDTAPDSDPSAVTLVNGHAVTPGLPATLSLPHGTLIMSSTGAWTFTPNGAANALAVGETATETVTYTVSDGNGGTDTATLEIEITGVNDAPVGVGSIPDHRNFEGVGVNVDVAGFFDDPDTSDVLSFSASGLPPGLTIDPHTGVISGTIALGAAAGGPYDVTVTVSDGHGGTVSLDFEWAVDMMAAPPAPPAPGPLPLPPLPGVGPGGETDHVISDMVDGMGGLGSGLLPADHIIVRTVESLGSLNSAGHLGDETQVIARLAAWAERQGRDARWMADLLDALDQHPYAGDAAPLSLNQDGQALLAVRTLLEDGALFIGIDGLKAGARVLGVTGAGGAALPDEIAVVDPQTLVVNVRAGARRYVIEVTGQGPGGGIFTWPLVVDPQNGRIALTADGGQQIGRLIDAMRNQIAKASPAAGPPPGFMIAAQ